MSRGYHDPLDLDSLLHPAQAFACPQDVVRDPDLTLTEKRAILSSWASDACAVESAPALRRVGQNRVTTFDEILDALRILDAEAPAAPPAAHARGRLRHPWARRFEGARRGMQ